MQLSKRYFFDILAKSRHVLRLSSPCFIQKSALYQKTADSWNLLQTLLKAAGARPVRIQSRLASAPKIILQVIYRNLEWLPLICRRRLGPCGCS